MVLTNFPILISLSAVKSFFCNLVTMDLFVWDFPSHEIPGKKTHPNPLDLIICSYKFW